MPAMAAADRQKRKNALKSRGSGLEDFVARLNIVDLFAGVGGLSLGAARAGFNVAAAVEMEAHALTYHGLNFPNSRHVARDVATLTGADIRELADTPKGAFGLIGGPPCQGFSDMGLKDANDPRNHLLGHFFRLVAESRPAFYVAENVPGLIKERNRPTLETALKLVPDNYVKLQPFIAKASEFGAPTIRARVFFIGYDPDQLGVIDESLFVSQEADDVKVGRALRGLPRQLSTWTTEEQSWRAVAPYAEGAFEARLLDMVPPNVGHAQSLRALKRHRLVSGFLGTTHSQATMERFKAVRPGTSDPISKCFRLSKSGYCPTLRAGTGPERGSHQALRPIHPSAPRVISPREGARLQGFPDWFQFHPTKWHAFRQIGNSVSPIVAERILGVIQRAS